LALLQHLHRDLHQTVVVITHHAAVGDIADRVAVMRDGAIVGLQVHPRPQTVEAIRW